MKGSAFESFLLGKAGELLFQINDLRKINRVKILTTAMRENLRVTFSVSSLFKTP